MEVSQTQCPTDKQQYHLQLTYMQTITACTLILPSQAELIEGIILHDLTPI